jgi:plasmid stabilization system protein ParE
MILFAKPDVITAPVTSQTRKWTSFETQAALTENRRAFIDDTRGGQPVESGFRVLVISRGRSGYLALYRYDEARDRVLVLTIRHQREAGYTG